jgi:tryptophan synthase
MKTLEDKPSKYFESDFLGAEVVTVGAGSRTLRDAVNEALRAWVMKLETAHYVIGSTLASTPSLPSSELSSPSSVTRPRPRCSKNRGKHPDAVVSCVGSGNNAVGMF